MAQERPGEHRLRTDAAAPLPTKPSIPPATALPVSLNEHRARDVKVWGSGGANPDTV